MSKSHQNVMIITRDEPTGKFKDIRRQEEEKYYQSKNIEIKNNNEINFVKDKSSLITVGKNQWDSASEEDRSAIFTYGLANCLAIIAYNPKHQKASLAHYSGEEAGDGDEHNPINNTQLVFKKLSSFIFDLNNKVKKDSDDETLVVLFKGSAFTTGPSNEFITEDFYDFFSQKSEENKSELSVINLMDNNSVTGLLYSALLFNPKNGALHLISDKRETKEILTTLTAANSSLELKGAKNEITPSKDIDLTIEEDTSDEDEDLQFSDFTSYHEEAPSEKKTQIPDENRQLSKKNLFTETQAQQSSEEHWDNFSDDESPVNENNKNKPPPN